MYRIAVTNRHLCKEDFLSRIVKLAKTTYYQAILLREKDLAEEEYEILARDVLAICNQYEKKCILHNFEEVALRLHHPYLHLPLSRWNTFSEEKRRVLQEKMVEIGTSVHSLEQLGEAKNMGATYVVAGHVFSTNCKPGLEPRGTEFITSICQKSKVPVYGIGGIHPENENDVVEAGAAGVCIMSGCMGPVSFMEAKLDRE